MIYRAPLEKPINKGIEENLILHDSNKKLSKITKKRQNSIVSDCVFVFYC